MADGRVDVKAARCHIKEPGTTTATGMLRIRWRMSLLLEPRKR
jgi:hypothetical protein